MKKQRSTTIRHELIVRHAVLPSGRAGTSIAVDSGRIVAVDDDAALAEAVGATEIDARGNLVTPPFVDAHFHMDATLSYGLPRVNQSGTLLEGIALWGELKPQLTHDAIVERALAYCDWAVAKGLLAIRSHVDVCDDRLLAVDALLHVKEKVKPYLDLQLVAFPQDGLLRSPTARANLIRALDKGVDVVGGIPHFERTMAEGAESVRILCEIAAERGLPVDMHCDETDDPLSRHIETLAFHTQRLGSARARERLAPDVDALDGQLLRVEADSADGRGRRIGGRQSADQHHHPGPARHVSETPRHDPGARAAGRRRPGRLRPRLRDGPVVQPGLGRHARGRAHGTARRADDRAGRDARSASMRSRSRPARILGLDGYGIAPGCHADFVLLQARDPIEAIRLRATRLAVVRRGRVIARTPEATATLDLPGRPGAIDFRR